MNYLTSPEFAVLASLALIVSNVALWFRLRRPKDAPEEPITMSGGSLDMTSAGWDIIGNVGTYRATHPVQTVHFSCDRLVFAQHTVNANFSVTIRYENKGNANDFHLITLAYRHSTRKVTMTISGSTGIPNHIILRMFLLQPTPAKPHPFPGWHATQITSTDLNDITRCTSSPANFLLALDIR